MAKDFSVTVTFTFSLSAPSEEEAERRAWRVADALAMLPVGFHATWWPDLESPEVEVCEA